MLSTDPPIPEPIMLAHFGIMGAHLPGDGSVNPGKLALASWDGRAAWDDDGLLTFASADGAMWEASEDRLERTLPLSHGGVEITAWRGGAEVSRKIMLA